MKFLKIMKSGTWILTGMLGLTALIGSTWLVMEADSVATPPDNKEIKLAYERKLNEKKNSRANRRKLNRQNRRITGKKRPEVKSSKIRKRSRVKKDIKRKSSLKKMSIKGKSGKFNMPRIPGARMPGTGNEKLKKQTMGKEKSEAYENKLQDARLRRDKRRYERMDARIDRLNKRIETLKENGTPAQQERLKRSIERLQKRKTKMKERLEEADLL
ncbi:MAG: hypothetical protein PF689_09055 [Deltaproteobacteria bacterium]|jgi:hypothetical protein|nr:hypothetical protein [Deltaproteobacteria bacterium]